MFEQPQVNEQQVRVRFAPSPTGNLHIGGARTSLFNWLFARSCQGKFILRIEDTDKQRSKKEFLDEILNSLEWLGMSWDELYFQSERFDIYRDYAGRLLDKGLAYKERAEGGDGEAVVFKVQPQKVKIFDIIRGEIEFDSESIKDQVLMKSDNTPTYNFACVIDDALMNMTHIIRGDDHISNTPKQVIIYNALGFKPPKFAHLPLILGSEGGRLSKRTGATAISDFRKMGYLPEGLLNYLLLLGWSPGANQEIIGMEEAIRKFSLKKANKTAATFDFDKLEWINGQHIKKADPERLADLVVPFLREGKIMEGNNFDRNFILYLVKLLHNRMLLLTDFVKWGRAFFSDNLEFEPEGVEKYLAQDLSKSFLLLNERFKALAPFKEEAIEKAFRDLTVELGIKTGDLVHPVRLALTGRTAGPGLFETIAILGKDKTISRLNFWIKKWQGK